MSEEKDAASTPPKYSRYRSVRHQAQPTKTQEAPPVPEDAPPFTRTKSMARYRRSRIVDAPVPSIPSVPIPTPQRTQTSAAQHHPTPRNPARRVTEPVPSTQRPVPAEREQVRPKETERERLRRKAQEYRDREEAHRKLEEQEAREQAEEEAELARRQSEEAAKILAEQKRKDLERLEAELAAAPIAPRVKSPAREKFSLFSRKRAGTRSTPPRTSESGSGSTNSMMRTRSNEPPRGIIEGGGGIVPGTDAPMSAVNAGERRVLIRCKQSSINLPINPETTPVDITFSAANIMTQDISPSTAVLLESYTQLGLERRIRKYEHVRDIMNSWDRDTQNALLLQSSDSPNNDYDLETSAVPKEAPPDTTVYMYHSQKRGKWNKRYITLLSSGQIYVAKKPNLSTSDKDVNNICHLSDFDIYTNTPQHTRKVLKPPKKHCYAVKSQQKTTMFLSTENFVHYFSTDDSALAAKWYTAVQSWRSWYLVNRMGEGARKASKTTKTVKATPTHKIQLSVDENPYTIGSFAPLLNLDRFNNPASQPKRAEEFDEEDENRPLQIPFHLRNSAAIAAPKRGKDKRPPVAYKAPAAETEEFSSSGLLGRTYSQRQKALQSRESSSQTTGFVGGALLSREGGHQRSMSMKSVKRPTTSGEGLPKPLLDFTPQFKEAPQWDRSKKGKGVRGVEGPLVDVATTHEAAMLARELMPEQNMFRREEKSAAMRPKTAGGGGRPLVEGAGSGRR